MSLFDDLPAMSWRTDATGSGLYFNRAWLEFRGTSLDQELGDGWADGVHADDAPGVLTRWREAVTRQQPFTMEYRLMHRSGEYRTIMDLGRPFHDADGNVVGYVGSAFDLSEQRRLEQQLRQSQKMEAVGQLAGGIAHDFNNILMAIEGHCEFALDALTGDSDAYWEVEEIRRAAQRASGLTRQLLAYSRRQVLQPHIFEMGSVLADARDMMRRIIPESIELHFDYPATGARVRADRAQIEQVVLNLAINARDAMPDGGALSFAVTAADADDSDRRTHPFITPGEYVTLTVTDTGTGMSAEILSHIFEPFYTTKPAGRGSGLGLAMVYGIVKQSGGFILARSEPGCGSTLEVLLPQVHEPAVSHQRSGGGVTMHGTESVLVVEDEEAVRRLIVRALTLKGYHVLEAGDAAAALELLETTGAQPALLVTDVVLPQMSGPELAAQLAERQPDLSILLISGFPRDHFGHQLPDHWADAFLEKPFTPADLIQCVRRVLDAPRQTRTGAGG